MKKDTKTATMTTPATPAPSPVKKVAAKPAKPAVVKQKVAAPAAPIPPVVKAQKPVAAPAAPVAPAVKAQKPAAATLIAAQIDIGFGNTLYIRGEGPGLSWETGVPLDCITDDKWSISLQGATKPAVFKFLVNDLTWSAGEDYVVPPGGSVTLVPTF